MPSARWRPRTCIWPAMAPSPRLPLRHPANLASTRLSYYNTVMDFTTVSHKYQVVIAKRVREQFGLTPGQQLQVLALQGRIELVPSQPPAALRGFLQGENTFQREPDRL